MRIAALVAALCVAAPLAAQQDVAGARARAAARPVITAGAEGQARVTPDRAIISIGVETHAATAAQAGAENARHQRAVIDTIKAMGVAAEQISTINYNVYPQQRYEPNKGDTAPRIVGYTVSNTVRVEVRKLDQVGPIIDAALAKGANTISSLDFFSSNEDDARRSALAAAVQRARGDAEAMARGAGGQLGDLVELSSQFASIPRAMPTAMAFDAVARKAPTPINPGEQTITVSVTGRWRFIQSTK